LVKNSIGGDEDGVTDERVGDWTKRGTLRLRRLRWVHPTGTTRSTSLTGPSRASEPTIAASPGWRSVGADTGSALGATVVSTSSGAISGDLETTCMAALDAELGENAAAAASMK
jgi:hypothetical protein